MNVSEISDFREYVEEQQQLCYGVELGGTPAVVGSLARQYDFLLETIDTYQEINQPQLNENQQIVLEWLKEEQTKNPELSIFGTLSVLFDESENRFMSLDVIDALNDLSNSRQAGVFQAFSQWALEQEEE
ncbi:MAG: hypothetical protein KIC96_07710 [Enterococcus casseliflavus]|nr:hypothetical protein [Enterococcus casseliflavus]MDU3374121.1 hypothetical protein [Enterococcus casseliflavus]